jgi:pimeloyl-ACP methyl ester carboxylesterase
MSNLLIAARTAFSERVPEETRTVNGRDWGVIRNGAFGPAVVLLPGTLGRADIFWQQIAALADDARVLSLSYPETGGIANWTRDIADLIVAEDMTGATVLGSSLGGYVAQYLTAKYPDLCGGLIAANTLPDAGIVKTMPPYALELHTVPIEALREGFLGGLKGWLTPDHPYADLAGLLIAEVEGRIPGPELRARLLALKTAPELPAQRLPDDRVSTVQSEDDHLIAPPVRAALREALRPARAFCFTAASHFPYVTRAEDYTAMLREFLSLDPVGTHWPKGKEATL